MPSPSVSGGTRCLPSGETIAVIAAAAQRLAVAPRRARSQRDLLVGQPAGGVDHEAARLQRVVADRHLDLLARRSGRPASRGTGAQWISSCVGHQRVARERVVVLPAGQRADAADARCRPPQARAVALAPDHALVVGRRDLAALEQQRCRRRRRRAACCRAMPWSRSLTPSTTTMRVARARRAAIASVTGPGTTTASLVEREVLGARPARAASMKEKYGIVGDEGLGKDDELRALAPRPRRWRCSTLSSGAVAAVEHRR